ncbi:hypothetical protein JCGZ_05746 [Jatropha curcas]|uniref:EF-hand domain-containing protein n=1 Tax=Jatropha curcas TaxID=180498 RepID=A0A067LJ57_JATCU|nr:hypothetical protein JCGZ_05746 [Jatropha curcas]
MEELKLKSPLIIAVIDDSKSNDTVAAKLASFLKYPLVDQNDITRALLNLITPTQLPDELTSNLPFETVCQITSTQLDLNINLVLNLAPSHSTHLKKLVGLASSRKAHLIIMECGSQNNNNRGYDIERVPKIRVDKNSLDLQKIVPEMFILLKKKDEDDAMETENLEKSNIRQPTNDHLHALNFYDQQKNIEFECRRCSRPCDGTSYKCEDCDEFNLHKVCAESASKTENGEHIFGLRSRNSDVAAAYHHCDICRQDIERGQLYYECHENSFEFADIHSMCMPIESQAIDAIISRKMLIKQELRRHRLNKMNDELLRNILRTFDEDKDKIVSQAELRKFGSYIDYYRW